MTMAGWSARASACRPGYMRQPPLAQSYSFAAMARFAQNKSHRWAIAAAPSTAKHGDQIVDPDRRNVEQAGIGLAELENHVNRAGDRDRPKRLDGDAEHVERAQQSVAHEQQRRPTDDDKDKKLWHWIGQLTGHQQGRFHHLHEIGHGSGDELLLLVRGGLEAGEKTLFVM